MPLATTRALVEDAYRDGTGIAAFNVITLEHAEAIAAGAEAAGRPIIMQLSQNAVRYHHGRVGPILAATLTVAAEASVPAAVHLDHIDDIVLLHAGADAGISSAMFDGSALPYAENVTATRAAVQWAHSRELFLEAELGEIGGKDGVHAPGARTVPADAASFVDATGVDALAVAVGSSHAMQTRTATLDFALITELRTALPVPLVLHGSSGVSDADLRDAIRAGMTKINIGTLLNLTFTSAVREALAANPTLVDPRRYLTPARAAVADAVAQALTALHT